MIIKFILACVCLGVFFIFFAFWWHINNCVRYIRSLGNKDDGNIKRQRIKFQGSTTYPCFFVPSKTIHHLPIESICKILITSTHFSIEIITGYKSMPHPHLGDVNVHHMAMLFGFFLGAWVEILVHYKVPLPKRIPQVMGVLAFAMEAIMMILHLHGRTLIDVHIHQLLAIAMTCSMIGALAECFDPNNFWFIVARSFFALTQGTWLIQAAYVLWPATKNPYFLWDPNSHRSVSLLTMCFAYHLAGNATILIIIYLLIHKVISILSPKSNLNPTANDNELNNGYKLIFDADNEENEL